MQTIVAPQQAPWIHTFIAVRYSSSGSKRVKWAIRRVPNAIGVSYRDVARVALVLRTCAVAVEAGCRFRLAPPTS